MRFKSPQDIQHKISQIDTHRSFSQTKNCQTNRAILWITWVCQNMTEHSHSLKNFISVHKNSTHPGTHETGVSQRGSKTIPGGASLLLQKIFLEKQFFLMILFANFRKNSENFVKLHTNDLKKSNCRRHCFDLLHVLLLEKNDW